MSTNQDQSDEAFEQAETSGALDHLIPSEQEMREAVPMRHFLEKRFVCPQCNGTHFGRDIGGTNEHPLLLETVRCHDQHGKGCQWRGEWPPKEDSSRARNQAETDQQLLDIAAQLARNWTEDFVRTRTRDREGESEYIAAFRDGIAEQLEDCAAALETAFGIKP